MAQRCARMASEVRRWRTWGSVGAARTARRPRGAVLEDAVAEGALIEVASGYYGEQGPDGRDEEREDKGADERGLQVGCVADVAEAGADGAGEALGWESGLEEWDALPVDEDPDDSGEGEGVEQEDIGGAGVGRFWKSGDHEAAEGAGPTARAQVVAGSVEADGLGDEFLAGDEARGRWPARRGCSWRSRC